MGKFQNALKKATSKRDVKKPKAKHLQSLETYFEEQPFAKVAELLQKSLTGKKPFTRLRTLMVIHHLINKKKHEVINWFGVVDMHIDYLPNYIMVPLASPYFTYLKQKCKTIGTVLLFLSPVLLNNIKNNTQELIAKTEELINLTQSLISMKEPLINLLKNKLADNISPEICTWVLADSQMIYNSLKMAVGSLWQYFSGFEAYTANRAREIFIKYNNFVAHLKDFAEKCPEEYPGLIPTFSALSEKTMEQINAQVIGKENLNMSKNLLKFEMVEKDGSPVKKKNNFSADLESLNFNNRNEGARNSLNLNNNHQALGNFNPLAMYSTNMFYGPQQFYYQPFPQYRP